jgi:hypothetical protein
MHCYVIGGMGFGVWFSAVDEHGLAGWWVWSIVPISLGGTFFSPFFALSCEHYNHN